MKAEEILWRILYIPNFYYTARIVKFIISVYVINVTKSYWIAKIHLNIPKKFQIFKAHHINFTSC